MTLVYRAIWDDDLVNPIVALEEEYVGWCRSKGIEDADIPYRGSTELDSNRSIEVRRAEAEAGAALRYTLREVDPQGRTWTTTATALRDPSAKTFWIDLDLDDPSGARPEMAAPRLVRNLLRMDTEPRLFGLPLRSDALVVKPDAAHEVAELILDDAREVPIVVFSPKRNEPPNDVLLRANKAAETLAGVAHIYALSEQGIDRLNGALHRDLAVYGGAVRMYLPGVDVDSGDFRMHRWIRWELISQHPRRAASMLSGQIVRLQIHQPIPDLWGRLEHLLRRPDEQAVDARVNDLVLRRQDDEGLSSSEYRTRIDQLTRELAEAELLAESFASDVSKSNELLERISREKEELHYNLAAELEMAILQREALRQTLRATQMPERTADDTSVDVHLLPVPSTCVEAVALAYQHLSNVVIHEDAPVDVEELDDSPSYSVWGANLWQGLLALHDYVDAKRTDPTIPGLKLWFDNHPEIWSPNKFASTESDTVLQDRRLRQHRVLPVAKDIDPGGRILMDAHLKIQQKGGGNIPRVYFHDDVAGVTGKFHVGFIGPHRHMPNTKT